MWKDYWKGRWLSRHTKHWSIIAQESTSYSKWVRLAHPLLKVDAQSQYRVSKKNQTTAWNIRKIVPKSWKKKGKSVKKYLIARHVFRHESLSWAGFTTRHPTQSGKKCFHEKRPHSMFTLRCIKSTVGISGILFSGRCYGKPVWRQKLKLLAFICGKCTRAQINWTTY